MVSMFTRQSSVYQPTMMMVANPARPGSAGQEKWFSPCPRSRLRILSREVIGSAVASDRSFSTLYYYTTVLLIVRLNLVLTLGIPPAFRDAVHILYSILHIVNRHWVCPEFTPSTYYIIYIVNRHWVCPEFTPSTYYIIYISSTAIGSVPNLSDHSIIAYRWRTFTAESTSDAFQAYTMGQQIVFSTTTGHAFFFRTQYSYWYFLKKNQNAPRS